MQQSLTYVRVAHASKEVHPGVVYLHHFGTGWQELVFGSHAKADKFRDGFKERFA